jgi:hypothetical protein
VGIWCADGAGRSCRRLLRGTLSGRANPTVLRWIVIGLGFAVMAYYIWTLSGPPEPLIGGK